MTILHTEPRDEGEAVLEHPSTSDPRFLRFMAILESHGLIDAEGTAKVPHKIMRGVGPEGYLYRVEWNTSSANAGVTDAKRSAD